VPIVLSSYQGPVDLDVQGNIPVAHQTHVVPHNRVEAWGHVGDRLHVAQGLEAPDSLGQPRPRHQEVNVAHGTQPDAGVEAQCEGRTLQDNDGDSRTS